MKREIKAEKEIEFKSPPYQKTQEKEFERMAAKMIDVISERFKNQAIKSLNQTTVKKFADAQTGNYAKVFLALAKKVSRKMVKQFNDDRIEELTKTILLKVNKANRAGLYQLVEKRIGISSTELMQTEGLSATINALNLETAQWMKRLRDDTLDFYTANTLRVMAQGGSIEDVLGELSSVEGKRKDHARFTARNQIANYNSLLTKTRAQNLGITKAKWVTSRDERVRPCHKARNGKEFDLSKGLYSSCDKKTLLPGVDYQCFPSGSKLNHTSFCNKLYRRRFTGKLTEIVTENGVVLRSTPNHPVFTTNGFKPAHLINSDDYIVKAVDKSLDIVKLYGQDPIPTIDQVFGALDLLGVESSVAPAISGKFHGDISDGEINIIELDSLLVNEINPVVREKFLKLNLSVSDEKIVLDTLTCVGKGFFGSVALDGTSASSMSTLNLVRSSFLAHLTPLELFSFTLGSWSDAGVKKSFSNDTPANRKVFSDCIFAFSVLVHGLDIIDRKIDLIALDSLPKLDTHLFKMPRESSGVNVDFLGDITEGSAIRYEADRVVECRVFDFSGHVYNLETVSSDYIVNTTAVSNCRCNYELIIPEE